MSLLITPSVTAVL